RAQAQPDDPLYLFLEKGETLTESYTYAEMDSRARALAARLQQAGLAGERALLLFPSGIDYLAAFWGCLYAGVIAVPVYPPQMGKQWGRIQAIIADCQPRLCLTNRNILSSLEHQMPEALGSLDMQQLVLDDIAPEAASQWAAPDINGHSLAFLQYTSGSTGQPKGVRVTHGNLLANEAIIDHFMAPPSGPAIVVTWLPLFHDMGLIGTGLYPAYQGGCVYIMTPLAFIQSPLRWLSAISRYRANISGGPNFAYDLCVSKIPQDDLASLDLSAWRVAFNGAEPVRAATLAAFEQHVASAGFRSTAFMPCYGMAETTLMVTGEPATAIARQLHVDRLRLQQGQAVPAASATPETQALVSCGHTGPGLQLQIVDPDRQQALPDGQVGEVWVSGTSVCDGYWARPALSADTFRAPLSDAAASGWLRTGDLGFCLDGHLYLTARLKDLIIVRGRNHYPPDIEQTVEQAHPAFLAGGGAAFAHDQNGSEQLVIVQEIERGSLRQHPAETLFQAIRQALGEVHELQPHAIALIRRRTLPKTSSGKVQRSATRQAWLQGQLPIEAQWIQPAEATDAPGQTPPPQLTTEALASWVQNWMQAKLHLRPGDIDLQDPISAYGIDSMSMVEFEDEVSAFLGVNWPVRDFLLTEPSIQEVIERGWEVYQEAQG
ncbi:MAG: hypothetical protein D6722_26280, partial [Bacteroidetes bacterium]